ncbi:hypothetical protein HDU98_004706 [Podochytrium sp. JEL0797]|nr:hypothetical protein HDU98_004706 [Podochytrium sp. JEL0797]
MVATDIITNDPHAWIREVLQRVPGVLNILMIPFLMYTPYYAPAVFSAYFAHLIGVFFMFSVRTGTGVLYTLWRSWQHAQVDWVKKRDDDVAELRRTLSVDQEKMGERELEFLTVKDIFHVIVIPNYKESLETLTETLDVLASHALAKTNYKVCLGMEATEEGCEAKALSLTTQYASSFHTITSTVHPKNLPGEIRGKSSNSNWACTQLFNRFNTTGSFLPPPTEKPLDATFDEGRTDPAILQHIFTCIDADTCFAADYFTTVAYEYTNLDVYARKAAMFVPSLIFDRNSDEVNILVRVYDMSWSSAQMSYFLPGFPFKSAMSAYSVPMELARAVGFWDTTKEALGEDMHMTIKCTFATSGRLRVIPIYSPASQFNVCGDKPTMTSSLYARLVQLRRHMWGLLDCGYTLRMGILWLCGRGTQLPKSYFLPPNQTREPLRKLVQQVINIYVTVFSMLELFIWSTHIFLTCFLIGLVVPGTALSPSILAPISRAWWGYLTGSPDTPVSPVVLDCLEVIFFLQMRLVFPFTILFVSYEAYYYWNAEGRWKFNNSAKNAGEALSIHPVLGMRPGTLAKKRQWWKVLEWMCYPLVALATGLFVLDTSIWHLLTDELEYKVAAKPVKDKGFEKLGLLGSELKND